MPSAIVVDDSIIVRKNIKGILQRMNVNVVAEAANGLLGFEEYKKHKPDIVTMDITMPVMDGICSLKEILSFNPHAKVIMISAIDQKEKVFEALKIGALHYLIKPIDELKTIRTIEETLNRSFEEDEAPRFEQSVNQKPAERNITPFIIENDNGLIKIKILDTISDEGANSLNNIINGFLFIKPLSIEFISDRSDYMFGDNFNKLNSLVQIVKDAGGDAKIIAN